MFDNPDDAPLLIDFILVPEFSLMAFTSAIEPLRASNRLSDRELYKWRILSPGGGMVSASNGVEVSTTAVCTYDTRSKLIFVVSGLEIGLFEDERLSGHLRRASRQGAMIGALCSGSHLLARAGLFTGKILLVLAKSFQK